jgi:hypothetical protein
MPAQSERTPSFAILFAVAFLLIALQLFVQYWAATASTLFDSDDAMRLVEVRRLLSGQGWFDLHEPRVAPPLGYDSHWSRLIDLGLAGLFLLFRLFTDGDMAERLMRAVWPVLWIAPTLAGVAAIAWRIAGRPAALITIAFAAIGLPAFHQFTPGRIDHHNVQIALAVLAIAATVWSDRLRWTAPAAGLASALALAVGLESLPYLVLSGVALGAHAIRARTALAALLNYGIALALGTAAAFLASVDPARWSDSACDAIAVNSAAAVVAGGLALSCGAILLARSTSDRMLHRAAVVGASTVLSALVFATIEPRCLGGPYAMMDPTARVLWLDHVPEMRSLLATAQQLPVLATWIAAFPLLALVATAGLGLDRTMRRKPDFQVGAAAFLISVVLTIVVIRGFSYSIWFGMPLVAAWVLHLFVRLKLTSALARALATFAAAPLTLSLAASTLAHATATESAAIPDQRSCFDEASYADLARLPEGIVAVNVLDYAPHVLALTPHAVMAAPYHRLSAAILDNYRAFTASPDAAREIFRKHHVNYLAICGDRGPVGADAAALQAGLWGLLQAGRAPDWLVPVARGGFLIYRIKT